MTELIVFVLERARAEFLYDELQKLAETKLDEAKDRYDELASAALDHIADQLHTALYEGGEGDEG